MEQHPNARLTTRGEGGPGLPDRIRRSGRRCRPPNGRKPTDGKQVPAPQQVLVGAGRELWRGAGCPGSPTPTGSPARSGGAALSPSPYATSARGPGSWSTWTPRRSRGSRTAAAGGPAGNPSSRARHVYTRSYSPWQNGKVGRMNRIIAQEWQYGRARESEAGRADALPAFIER